ncbi:MAG: glycosyl hydrolase family 18 protein, partial [Oscillospiraceae bacterium]
KACGFSGSKDPTFQRIPQYLENKAYLCADGTKFQFDKKWDADAQTSYISTTSPDGRELFVLSYIEPQGLTAKTDYIKKYNLGGTMFWEFGADYNNLLTTQIAKELNINQPAKPAEPEKVPNPTTGNPAPIAATIVFVASICGIVALKKRK